MRREPAFVHFVRLALLRGQENSKGRDGGSDMILGVMRVGACPVDETT